MRPLTIMPLFHKRLNKRVTKRKEWTGQVILLNQIFSDAWSWEPSKGGSHNRSLYFLLSLHSTPAPSIHLHLSPPSVKYSTILSSRVMLSFHYVRGCLLTSTAFTPFLQLLIISSPILLSEQTN